jgi:MATE family multidrug resistance protein
MGKVAYERVAQLGDDDDDDDGDDDECAALTAPASSSDGDDRSTNGGKAGAADVDQRAAERLQRNAGPPPSLGASVLALIRLAYPMAASSFLDGLTRQLTIMMVGHIGSTELGAATLGTMTCNVTGFSLCFGGMSALDTLASQAFGAKNYPLVGIWSQRGLLCLTAIGIPISCVWAFATDDILHALGVGDEETIALSVLFARYMIIGFWPTLFSRVLQGFLRSQRIVRPVMYCSMVGGVVTASISWVWVEQFGFIGAPLAQGFGSWFNFLLLLGVTRWRGLHEKCWGGWSWEATHSLGIVAKLGLAGMASTMGQWWSWVRASHPPVSSVVATQARSSLTPNQVTACFSPRISHGAAIAAGDRRWLRRHARTNLAGCALVHHQPRIL